MTSRISGVTFCFLQYTSTLKLRNGYIENGSAVLPCLWSVENMCGADCETRTCPVERMVAGAVLRDRGCVSSDLCGLVPCSSDESTFRGHRTRCLEIRALLKEQSGVCLGGEC